MPDGEKFSYNANDEWICRKANISLTTDGEEEFTSPSNDAVWNSSEYEPACWIRASNKTMRQLHLFLITHHFTNLVASQE